MKMMSDIDRYFNYRYISWAERARADRKAKEIFSAISEAEIFFDQLSFGVRSPSRISAGAYVEFYHNKSQGVVRAYILGYSAPYRSMSEEINASILEFPLENFGVQDMEIVTPSLDGWGMYHICISGKVNMGADSRIALSDICAAVKKDRAIARKYRVNDPWIPQAEWPDREHNLKVRKEFLRSAQALCPNCCGKGSFASMAIPRADWESGATGYGLFSCNRTNGREACRVCGGSGGKYFRWYVAENPELATVSFIPGSGLLPG